MKTSKHVGTAVALALVGTLAAQSAFACQAPQAPRAMPDGRNSELQVMLDSKRQIENYVDRVADYMSCETDALKLQEVKARQTELLNRFNAEVRAYKIANSPMVASRH